MTNKAVISSAQLFGILFLSRMVINITYSPLMFGSGNIWDHIISAVISFVLTFILVIPMYKICTLRPNMTIADNSYFLFGKLGYIFIFVYAVYYLCVCGYTLSMFNMFVTNVMSPNISVVVLSIAIILTSCYGAFKGIEALVRASGVLLALICLALIFLIISLIPQIDTLNYVPFMLSGTGDVKRGVLLMVSRTSCIPVMGMILPMVKGSVKKGIIKWNTAVYASIIVLIYVMVGSMGDYLKTQMFPVYTAASIAELGILKRLDALYLGIWSTGLFVKISLFLFVFSLCVSRIFGERSGRISVFVGGVLVAIAGILVEKYKQFSVYLYNVDFFLVFTIITAVIIPLLLLCMDAIKNRLRG